MTDLVKKEEEVVEQVVEPTEVELQAMEDGWQPKDKFEGEPSDWRPAKEFVERGELFRKIENLSKELKNTKSTMNALKGHYEKVKEVEFKSALETLKKEKKVAFETGDADAVIEIDEKIATVRETQKDQAQAERAQITEVPAEFTQWVQKNGWYNSDGEMREFADSIGKAYAISHPGSAPSEVLKHVSDRAKKAYPEKFVNERRNQASPTESPRGNPGRRTAEADFPMSEDETNVMNKLVKSGVMTKEKYIAELKKINGVR